ncbi:hypothetical protein Patl1_20175 [Pistacia atlantica]|uniref:Uncharacterized protein n=1 Tax=Pistacia atlantica TaxID=434234 RepID=A0ACC1BII6_9ROSI|nr:hypothetical protein Patl1_20175 [Pistacia atlantica]
MDLVQETDVLWLEQNEISDSGEKKVAGGTRGPSRAFGDLLAASGITDAMLDSLIALKDLEGVEGLPPLSEIEEIRFEKNTRKSSRDEIERRKQEEIAKARVRQVDDQGRAYGTVRRKCSIARVGFNLVKEKTKTLGLWDVNCTVKGGGVSGEPNVCSY